MFDLGRQTLTFHRVPYDHEATAAKIIAAGLPRALGEILWWNPVLHLVEWFRMAYYPTYPQGLFTPWYPMVCGTAFLLAGLAIERFTRSMRSLA